MTQLAENSATYEFLIANQTPARFWRRSAAQKNQALNRLRAGRAGLQRVANHLLSESGIVRMHQDRQLVRLNGEDLRELAVARKLFRRDAGRFQSRQRRAESYGIISAPGSYRRLVIGGPSGRFGLRGKAVNETDAAIGAHFESRAIFHTAFWAEHEHDSSADAGWGASGRLWFFLISFLVRLRWPLRSSRVLYRRLSRALDSEGDGIPAAKAESSDAALQVAALQFVQQRDQNARAGSADGMPERNGASIHVNLFRIELQLARNRDGSDGKCLVQFIQIDVAIAIPPGFRQQLFDGFNRCHHHPFGLNAADGLRDDARHRLLAKPRGGAFAGDDQRRGAVIRAGGIAGGHRAVFFECGLEARERFERCVLARRFVRLDDDRLAFLLRDFDGQYLVTHEAGFGGAHGFAMRIERVLVLLRARDFVLLGNELGGHAHVKVFVRFPQAINDHRVENFLVAEPVARARAFQQIGAVGHRLHAAGDNDFRFAQRDRLRCKAHGFQSRAANLVDSHRGHARMQPAAESGLSRGILSQPGLHHIAHNGFVHLLRVNPRAAHGFGNHSRAQLGSGKRRKASEEAPDRRAGGAENHRLFNILRLRHAGLLRMENYEGQYTSGAIKASNNSPVLFALYSPRQNLVRWASKHMAARGKTEGTTTRTADRRAGTPPEEIAAQLVGESANGRTAAQAATAGAVEAHAIKTHAATPEISSGFPLNAEQRAAVEHGEGPLLVVAGAGTGKTRVITERIRRLLEENPDLAGENILGLTFTDKAAGEMKWRVVQAVGERAEGVWLSTFHKFCLEKILREAAAGAQALEDIDHWILLRRHVGELGLQHFKRLQEPGEFLSDFVKFFSRCQDELVSPDDYDRYVASLREKHERTKTALEGDALAIAEDNLARQQELARVYRASERLLRERKLVTFGAQLLRAVELLRTDAALLEKLREQYRYILVDEFQDTNIAQLELLWLLAGDPGRTDAPRNILAVGDHHQAIYRFRGASFGSFTIFLKRFCGVRGSDANKFLVSLSRNYRSTQRILNVAHAVIENNEQSPLLPSGRLETEHREGERVRVAEFATAEEEAQWVASEIDRLHDAGAKWRSMAVLYRKHSHRTHLLEALRRRAIPFAIKGFSILSSTLVRDLLAWLRAIGQPSDNVACARALAAPYWGLEPRDLVRLTERAGKNRRALADEVESARNEAPFDKEGVRLGEFVQLANRLRILACKYTASDLLDELVAALGVTPLASDADRHYLERFVQFVREWEKKSEGKQLRDLLEYLAFFDEAGGDIGLEEELADDAVQLMTVHGAKGLEFPHVFILRLSKNDFPSGTRKAVFEFPPELMKEERPTGDFQIQEERRLFYVALTRAKQHLTLSTVVNRFKKPSPFLDDFLMNPKVQKSDTMQTSPRVVLPPMEEAAGPAPESAAAPGLFDRMQTETRAYSRVALWAKAFHPPRPEPLQLSASAIDAYERCPMKYMFRHLWSMRGGPHAAMTFGNVVHTTIKEFVAELRKRGRVPFEEVTAIFDREWSSAGFPDDYQEQEYRKAGRDQLAAFHETYSAAPAEVMYQEKAFELPLENEVIVTGRIDQINRIDRDSVEIVDYKTGKPREAKKANDDLQLSIYALAAREVLELEPKRLVLYNLMSNEAVATTRDAKSLAKAKERIGAVADQIRAGDFSAKPGFGCGNCDYKPLCPAHEQLIPISPAIGAPRAKN